MIATGQCTLICDGCGTPKEWESKKQKALYAVLKFNGFEIQDDGRLFRPSCVERAAAEAPAQGRRRGFTLIELLVILAIIGILIAATVPIFDAVANRPVESGAAIVQAAIVEARDLATRDGSAGVRLEPDAAWQFRRLADGTLDPARPIAYSTILPLVQPPPYSTGRVTVHSDGWPKWFTPAPGRLVLEESTFDADGRRCEPTAWAWNVRVGDVVQYLGRAYTVTGPTEVPIGSLNPEGYVNFGPPGAAPALDRGAGPVEWLYLTNRLDDDLTGYYGRSSGYVDDGWDGIDQDLDGLVDEDDEWEPERWGPGATQAPSGYRIDRRPVVAGLARSTRLPAPVVVDATAWAQAGLAADGSDARLRSQLPVDRYAGTVDLMFDASGRVTVPSLYGRPAARPLNRPWLHLWIADRGDVVDPDVTTDAATGRTTYALPAPARAALVSVEMDSGRIVAGGAGGLDPAGSMRAVEGGGR